MGVFRQNIAVDLGSANVKIAVEKKGIAVSDSSVVALRRSSGEVIAIGRKASNMDGKIDKDITVIRPVSGGVISEYTVTVNMIGFFLDDAIKNPIRRMVRPDIITPLHCNATNVSKRAVERALKDAGAGRVFFVEAPLAAAIGANLDVSAPSGKMIVSIGAEITDVAVISFDSIVTGLSVNVGGRSFDEAIKTYLKKEYKMIVGDNTAEKIKNENVCIYGDARVQPFDVSAYEISGRLPVDKFVKPDEMKKQLSEVAMPVVEAISRVLESTPPELVSDIYQRGITLTGGGSLLSGLDTFIMKSTGIDTVVADDPQNCVVNGCMKLISGMSNEKKSELMNR